MSNHLYIGSSEVDVTPDKSVILGGATISGKIRVDAIKDPLYAKTLIIRSNQRQLCIISLDLLMITKRYVELIRDEAERRWGFERDAIMIHATQNHKSPSLGHFKISDTYKGIPADLDWVRGGDEGFHAYAFKQIIDSIETAYHSMIPVEMGAASGIEGRVAFNRRMIMRDGSASMPSKSGPPQPHSRYLEGPIDPELGVVCFRELQQIAASGAEQGSDRDQDLKQDSQPSSQQIRALLLSYTCHPVHEITKFFISADWPGALSDQMKERLGGPCTPLVLNGACGNINPWDPYAEKPNDDAQYTGNILADTACKVIEGITFSDEAVLDWKIKRIQIPLRHMDETEVANAKQYLADNPIPKWLDEVVLDDKWVYASGLVDLYEQYERQPLYDYEVQVLRIGDAAFVGLPGEPFAETGMEIKLASPAYPTYIVHNTQFAGYIPTKEAFPHGGYETTTSNWSKFVPEAADMIAAASLELLRELF
ncbi:hypothetical protein [Paenibacillus eucommiae]|uniref:Neutral/alkaline non-lysosomal ceramidase N-terminal domain-containing protein n=1 Tax=Paenibacillus eucommiae TaxID=1355755 RepID=A0ABS4J3V8_9BACL|nr:hypothetical protein [Paenibacillus eucommiae]MBP1994498.1 hypothetical protein [Paenibacillus eucommiae]